MTRPGVLLDAGPIVALLSKRDTHHERAVQAFKDAAPPFRCCEPVVAEACFLMSSVHPAGPAEVLALARKGVFTIALSLADHWASLEALMKKYQDTPASLADASLIQCADRYDEPRILTFDAHFDLYRWRRQRRFERF